APTTGSPSTTRTTPGRTPWPPPGWCALAAVLVLASTAALVLGPPGPAGPYGWGLFALTGLLLAVAARAPGRIPFLATMAVAGADVLLLLARGAGPR
ncbi:hypothetical protein AB0D15_24480, partial [Streptomyces sp. NPDC048551]